MRQRFSGIKFWDGVVFGAFLATVTALLLFWVLSEAGKDLERIAGSIFAVVGTLFAAFIALGGVRSQIETQQNTDERNRMQELAAYKATLPLALSEMISVARNGMEAALDLPSMQGKGQGEVNEMLKIPTEVLDTLRNCIKNSDEISQDWLTVIVAMYQIYFARSTNVVTLTPVVRNGTNAILDRDRMELAINWATFHALVELAYDFSRGIECGIPQKFDSSRIESAFRLNGIDLNSFRFFTANGKSLKRFVDVRVATYKSRLARDFLKK